MFNIQICFGPVHSKSKISLFTFSRLKKPNSKLFSGINFLFVNRYSKFLKHKLRL